MTSGWKACVGAIWALVCASATLAAEADCYEKARVPAEQRVYRVHSLVLLDETTIFDATQQAHIREQLGGLVQSGSIVEIITFSAFVQGRYAAPGPTLRIAAPLSEETRNHMRKPDVQDFDVCVLISKKRALNVVNATLEQYFARATSELLRSDILGVLKEVGDSVMPRVFAKERRLVLVSDMLENSDISSFYGKGVPREIKPDEELAHAKAKGMIGDLHRARVFVIGAGVMPAEPRRSSALTYRASAVMGPLKKFWTDYFSRSNAQLIAFGQPLLLSPIAEGFQ